MVVLALIVQVQAARAVTVAIGALLAVTAQQAVVAFIIPTIQLLTSGLVQAVQQAQRQARHSSLPRPSTYTELTRHRRNH